MTFDEWWTKDRERIYRNRIKKSPSMLKWVAKCSWEEGRENYLEDILKKITTLKSPCGGDRG